MKPYNWFFGIVLIMIPVGICVVLAVGIVIVWWLIPEGTWGRAAGWGAVFITWIVWLVKLLFKHNML